MSQAGAAAMPDVRFQLRALPAYFAGRADELRTVAFVLRQPPDGRTIVACVHGAAGVGKTALAMAAGHAIRDAYPDAQIVVELNTHGAAPLTVEQARDRVLEAFHPAVQLPDDDDSLWNAYRSTLSRQRALLILDDVGDTPRAAQLLPPSPSAAIVTSRVALPFGASIRLDVLPHDDAVRMLRALCGRLSEAEAHALSRAVGEHAKALELAGGFLRARRTKPVAEYLDELRRSPVARLDLTSLLEGSWFALSAAERDGLGALSVMPADFDRQAALSLIGAGEDAQAGDALDELVAFSLLGFDDTRGRYDLHDLVRAFAAETVSAEARDAAQLRHAAHYTRVAWSADALYRRGGTDMVAALALFDGERVHIDVAFANLRHLQQPDGVLDLVDAVIHTGQKLRFRPSQRIEWLTAAIDAAVVLGRPRSEATAVGNLAWAWLDLGDIRRAADLYRRNLAICTSIGDRKGMSNALGGLGNAVGELGDHRQAVALFEQALSIHRDTGDLAGVIADLGNLGLAYTNLGNVRRASTYLEEQLVTARRAGDVYSEGNALGNLGLVSFRSGDVERALALWEERIVIAQRIGDRRGEGNARANIGAAHAERGDFTQAVTCFERALAIAREIGDLRSESEALSNLGAAHASLTHHVCAVECYEMQASIMRRLGDRGGEALAHWRLGLCLEALGDRAQAAVHMQIHVDYARLRGRPDADKLAARVDALRRTPGK